MNTVKVKFAEKAGAPSLPQVLQEVGAAFIAGWEGNADIDCLLGNETSRAGGMPLRQLPAGGLAHAPDYCGADTTLAAELLRLEGVETWLPCLTATAHKGAKASADPYAPEHVLVFPWRALMRVTAPQTTPEGALACALWWVLTDKSPVT